MHLDRQAINEFDPAALRALRRAAGLSRTQLAAAVGVAHDTIGRYERGTTHPSPSTIGLLADVLDVQPLDLLHGGGR